MWRPVLALGSAVVVLLGAYAAERLSTGMMSAVGLGAVLVAVPAGMAMTHL